MVALLAIAGIILAILLNRSTEVTVPSIIGMDEAPALQTILRNNLSFQEQGSFIPPEVTPSVFVGWILAIASL